VSIKGRHEILSCDATQVVRTGRIIRAFKWRGGGEGRRYSARSESNGEVAYVISKRICMELDIMEIGNVLECFQSDSLQKYS
jgi:hypothetical protein